MITNGSASLRVIVFLVAYKVTYDIFYVTALRKCSDWYGITVRACRKTTVWRCVYGISTAKLGGRVCLYDCMLELKSLPAWRPF